MNNTESGIHVLLVDDERISREVEAHLLSSGGCTVITAALPSEALEIFIRDKDDIDVVILDMIMPEMTGKELFVRMQQHKPHLKAVLLSGYGESKDIIEAQQRGMFACMQKPVSRQKLLETVRSAVASVHNQ
jgi:DNA-binding NtrC family response regulator